MSQMYCQRCGTPNTVGAKFCNSCGAPFVFSMPSPVQPQSPPPQPQPYQPPPVQQVFVQQAPPPKKSRWRTCLTIVGVILALGVCCAVVIGGYAYISLRPIQGTATNFLNALKNQDYVTAYNMSSAELQGDVGSPDGLKSFIEGNGFVIQEWAITNTQRFAETPPTGLVTGTVTFRNGQQSTVEVHLIIGPNAVWQVKGFGFGQ